MKKHYFLGAPLFAKDRKAALDEIRKDSSEVQSERLNLFLNRITEKTVGVLTIAGLVFAVSMFVLEKAGKPAVANSQIDEPSNWAVVLCIPSIIISICGIILLCWNLRTIWRRDHSNWNTADDEAEATLNLFAWRAIRLQISLYGIAGAATLSVIALGLLETQEIKGASAFASLELLSSLTRIWDHLSDLLPR